ncbi:MAG TPA: glucoamylase family protein, partial [Patescibacteria group bacterium]
AGNSLPYLIGNIYTPLTALFLGFLVFHYNYHFFWFTTPLLFLWLVSPYLAQRLSIPFSSTVNLNSSDKEFLLASAAAVWHYFSETVNEFSNYLPPDSYQGRIKKIITKTSPTNIGLYLVSCLSAYDLGLINKSELLRNLKNTMNSIKKLTRYRGHFYNWYDTSDLSPVKPFFISTVDSGNLLACLIVLRQACLSLSFDDLALSIDNLISSCDFGFLYNRERQLFTIGYDLHTGKSGLSYYDLMASEARLTGFLAIALKQVPTRHWYQLARPLTASEGNLALLSWGGSLFETLFSELFLNSYSGSLITTSNLTAIKTQIAFGQKNRIPWGISESAFYRLGSDNTYQYRIFGIPSLGLKPDLQAYKVISPYSSFLSLPHFPHESIKNLRRLRSLGLFSTYGFMEAVDYTSGIKKIVNSYMAHHQAISLVAINNCLNPHRLTGLFHSYPPVAAIETLLQEKVPGYPLFVDFDN